jgi:hypothetical protein
MTDSDSAHVQTLVAMIESRVSRPRVDGVLDSETVEAIDVVQHALSFVQHPCGLELWREAVRGNRLAPEARDAVAAMMGHLLAAVAHGEFEAVTRICDCLGAFLRREQEAKSMPESAESSHVSAS